MELNTGVQRHGGGNFLEELEDAGTFAQTALPLQEMPALPLKVTTLLLFKRSKPHMYN